MATNLLDEINKGAKNAQMKKKILSNFLAAPSLTISDLAKGLDLSVPTITKFLDEMCKAGYVVENGKLETNGGRHPSLYTLSADYCYFVGVALKREEISIGVVDFKGEVVAMKEKIPFELKDNLACVDELAEMVNYFIDEHSVQRERILNVCFSIPGRVNSKLGTSYSFFNFDDAPLATYLEQRLQLPVVIENDSRAMAFGEYMSFTDKLPESMIFVNISWGLGMAIIINGKLYDGVSGFSGEFGHNPGYNNEYICHCGKKGCIETEVSGSALFRNFIQNVKEGKNSIVLSAEPNPDKIALQHILDAVMKEDVLALELVEQIGIKLGRHVGGLINIFNPETVVIGGDLSIVGENLLHPVLTAIRKFTLSMMYCESDVKLSKLTSSANLRGACLLARSRTFE